MAKYKNISNKIHEIEIDNPASPNKKLNWLNIENAGKKEIEYLKKKYKFENEHLKNSFATKTAQRPSIENGNDYIFMIMQFPVFHDDHIISGEIDFFIGNGYLITLHNKNIETFNNFFSTSRKDPNSLISYQFESSAILLYEILEKLILNTYSILDKNSIVIEEVEDTIFAQKQKRSVTEILTLKRNIINIRKILQNHKNTIQKLMEMENKLMPEDDIADHYTFLLENSKKVWQILDNQKEMIDALYATNESLINYRTNEIMKTLTLFSVIVFPLTLLAAIFGMNTTEGMPFMNSANGFWQIILIMLIGCLIMILYFRKKKWL